MQKTERNKEILSLYGKIDPNTGDIYTLEGLGNKFGITRERVRQIFEKEGIVNRFPRKHYVVAICPRCGKERLVDGKRRPIAKFCSRGCLMRVKDHPIRDYSIEELKAMYRERNEKTKEYRRAYYQRPEVIARRHEYTKTKKFKEYQRQYARKRTQERRIARLRAEQA
jgi:hypothetical protein